LEPQWNPEEIMTEKTFPESPGLRLKMHANGKTGSYSVLVRVAGRKSRLQVGDFPGLTLTKAERIAAELRSDATRGKDLAAEKRELKVKAAAAGTVDDAADAYLAGLAKRSASHIRTETWALRAIIADMGAGKLAPSMITEAMVLRALDAEERDATRKAKYSALKRMITKLWRRRVIDENVFDRIDKVQPPTARERFLTAAEVQAVWGGLGHLSQPHQDLYRLLLCLPLRRGEASMITGEMVDLDEMTLTLPASVTKSDREFVVPLNRQAAEILAGRIAGCGLGALFLAPSSGRPISNFSKPLAKLQAVSGTSGWRLHDLRRTIATAMAEAGVDFAGVDTLLNHAASESKGGVKGIYNRAKLEEPKARAMRLWGDLLDRAIETGSFKARDNVLKIA